MNQKLPFNLQIPAVHTWAYFNLGWNLEISGSHIKVRLVSSPREEDEGRAFSIFFLHRWAQMLSYDILGNLYHFSGYFGYKIFCQLTFNLIDNQKLRTIFKNSHLIDNNGSNDPFMTNKSFQSLFHF